MKNVIGKTWLGTDISVFTSGIGKNHILLLGGFRGSDEHICRILMKTAESLENDTRQMKINREKLLSSATFHIIPTVNADGISLHEKGLDKFNPFFARCVRANRGSEDFSAWQANCRGADIARNFPAGWRDGAQYGTFPCAAGGIGEYPCSEKESFSLLAYMRRTSPHGVFVFLSGEGKIVLPEKTANAALVGSCLDLPVCVASTDRKLYITYAAGSPMLTAARAFGARALTVLLPENTNENAVIPKILLAAALL